MVRTWIYYTVPTQLQVQETVSSLVLKSQDLQKQQALLIISSILSSTFCYAVLSLGELGRWRVLHSAIRIVIIMNDYACRILFLQLKAPLGPVASCS